jgi:hypothetical protein
VTADGKNYLTTIYFPDVLLKFVKGINGTENFQNNFFDLNFYGTITTLLNGKVISGYWKGANVALEVNYPNSDPKNAIQAME